MSIKVLLADDSEIMRVAIVRVLDYDSRMVPNSEDVNGTWGSAKSYLSKWPNASGTARHDSYIGTGQMAS